MAASNDAQSCWPVRHSAASLFRLACVAVALLGAVASDANGLAAEDATERLIFVQEGELPIILSAPHGGTKAVPGVEARQGEEVPGATGRFVVSRDVGTEELATLIATGLERRFGKKPYVVKSLAHRKYLDPNRPVAAAYEDDKAKPVYDAYHKALAKFCREVNSKHRSGLLLDIHGQDALKDAVLRGTNNGKTVTLLRERFGDEAHVGATSLFGRLRAAGLKVHPDPLDGLDHARYSGGYIVQTYGSHQGFGIDAMQLEFGSDLRTQERRPLTANAVIDAVVAYCGDYLPSAPKSLAAPAP